MEGKGKGKAGKGGGEGIRGEGGREMREEKRDRSI
jgi:hypothetical protein